MNKCAYCGFENPEDAPNCAGCGEIFEETYPVAVSEAELPEVPPPETPEEPLPAEDVSPPPVVPHAGDNRVAYLVAVDGADLAQALAKAVIPYRTLRVMDEGGLEYYDILVTEEFFERACVVAEAWEAERVEATALPEVRFVSFGIQVRSKV